MSADYRIRPVDKPDAPPITFRAGTDDMARHLYRVGLAAAFAHGRRVEPMVLERHDPITASGIVVPEGAGIGVWTEVRTDDA